VLLSLIFLIAFAIGNLYSTYNTENSQTCSQNNTMKSWSNRMVFRHLRKRSG